MNNNDNSEEGFFNPDEIINLMDQLLDHDHEQLAKEELESPYIQEWDFEDQNRRTRTRRFSPPKNKNRLLKTTVRNGIDNYNRNHFYLFLSGIDKTYHDSRQCWSDIVKINSSPRYDNVILSFGYPDYELSISKDFLQNLLTIIKNRNKEITFSPMIPCVASILSLYLKPDLVFLAIQSMIDQDDKYFTKNKQEFAIMLQTIEDLISNNSKLIVYQHIKVLKLTIPEISLFLMPLLFSKKVDKRVTLTIFDAFIYDGRHILMKYVIGIIYFLQSRLLSTPTAEDFMNVIFSYITSLHNPSEMTELIKFTFSLNFIKTKKIASAEKKVKKQTDYQELINSISSPLPKYDEFDTFHQYGPVFGSNQSRRYTYHGPTKKTITINQMVNYSSNTNNGKLINNMQFHALKQLLPRCYKNYNAYPVFLLSNDGDSINGFIEKGKNCQISMLIIKTTSKVIGVVIESPFKPTPNCSHVGGPSTTVFDLTENKAYKSSLKNNYFLSMSNDSISIGGGSTGCAIFIVNYFANIYSEPCETFDSPALLENYKEMIIDLELYKLAI